jgi:hypothetical protein
LTEDLLSLQEGLCSIEVRRKNRIVFGFEPFQTRCTWALRQALYAPYPVQVIGALFLELEGNLSGY